LSRQPAVIQCTVCEGFLTVLAFSGYGRFILFRMFRRFGAHFPQFGEMAPKQLDDIIESSCDRAWVEDKQAHFTQLHDSWSALCRYIREELDKGQGVVVPETVAFLFKNEQAGGKAKRVPDVLVLRSFLTEHNLQAAPGVGPDDAVSSLGSLYETYPPLHPVNYTTVAQMAGHSKKAVVDAVKHIMYELVYCTRSHVDVVLDFGVAVLKIK
jgi:hypothetical protein